MLVHIRESFRKIVDRWSQVSLYPSVTGYGKGPDDILQLCIGRRVLFSYLTMSHACAEESALEEGNL